MSETTKRVVEAQEFRLTDGAGNLRAVLGLADNGEPRLVLIGSKGLAEFGGRLGGRPGLLLGDSNGKIRASILMDEAGNPSVALQGPDGKPQVAIGAECGKLNGLIVFDGGGRTVIRAVWDEQKHQSQLTLHDRNGKVRAELQLLPDGTPALLLFDPAGRPGVGVFENELAVLGPQGEPVWSSSPPEVI